jgi:hypothetical protein
MPDKQGHLRVDRLKYELCVLQVLRERLRRKEIESFLGGAQYLGEGDGNPSRESPVADTGVDRLETRGPCANDNLAGLRRQFAELDLVQDLGAAIVRYRNCLWHDFTLGRFD